MNLFTTGIALLMIVHEHPLSINLGSVVDSLADREPEIDRDGLVEWAEGQTPLVEVSPEGIESMQGSLVALIQGQDIAVEQKQALYGLEQFLDAVIDDKQVHYEDLSSDMLVSHVNASGLAEDLVDYTSYEDTIDTYFRNRITYPVYSSDAIAANYNSTPHLAESYENMPARRHVAATVLIIKARLAVGALYDAGMHGDELAMSASEGLEPLIKI